MARFGDLEASIMDVVGAAEAPVRVREVSDQLNRERPLAFNTVQTVMENLFHKGWLTRHKNGRAYWSQAARSRDAYVAQLLDEALSVAPDPAATLVRLVGAMDPAEIASLRAGLDAAEERDSGRGAPASPRSRAPSCCCTRPGPWWRVRGGCPEPPGPCARPARPSRSGWPAGPRSSAPSSRPGRRWRSRACRPP